MPTRWAGKGHVGLVRRFPVGVIYGITPFNFPLNLVGIVAPAIATGNTIVIKPSPRTPLSAIKLAEILKDAGVVPGQARIVILAERAGIATAPRRRASNTSRSPAVRLWAGTSSPRRVRSA